MQALVIGEHTIGPTWIWKQDHGTKAVKQHTEWEASGTLIDIYRKKYKKGSAITYVPDTEHNRENPKLGRRLYKFLVSEDLNKKETWL